MNKQNKYYIPKLEEFHLGFEYEYLGTIDNHNWEPVITDQEDLSIIFDDYEHEMDGKFYELYRVKYLDKEDVESLGWIEHLVNKNTYFIELHKNTFGTIYIKHYGKKWYIESDRHGEFIFIGTIKNKSELKKLMKQLSINE